MDVAGAFQRGKVTNSTDMSNMQYIIQYINVLNYLDTMISDTAGVTRQREGQTQGNQAVTNAQSDLTQSALVTEIYFDVHNKMWEDSLNSLLSVARRYYKENKKNYLQYVLDDLSMETIMISEDDLEDADLSVFVTDSAKEVTIFETLKQLSQAIIQNESGSAEKLQEAHEATIETYKASAYSAIMSALPENLQGLLQYAMAGGDDYEQFLNQSASFDTDNIVGQEAVIRYFYKNTANWDDKKIERYIAKLDEDELAEEAQDLSAQIEEANKAAQKAAIQKEEAARQAAIEQQKALQANIAQTIEKAGYIEQARKSNIKNFMFNPVRRADGSLTEYQRVLQSIQSNPDHLAQLADLLYDYDKEKGITYQRFEKNAKTTLTKDLKRHLEQSTSSKVNGLVIPGKSLKNSQTSKTTANDIDWKAFLGS